MDRERDWAEAMRAARAGDGAAYARLLSDIAAVLRRSVRVRLARAGAGPEEAEDIVQEVLIAIHNRRGTWDETRPFRPWVHGIARYKLADALRARRRRRAGQSLPIDDWAERIAAPAVEEPPRPHEIERALAGLSGREAGVLRGLALEGLTVAGLAERLALTEGAVRVALHRALRRLGARATDET